MNDELLSYYNRELNYLYQLAAEFAEVNPKVAGRLRLKRDTIDDPHIERLLQGVAYLNARIRRKLDDDFPELSDAMLGVLYPHYQRPIPSMAIVQFQCESDQTGGCTVPVDSTVETEHLHGEPCRFATKYPVDLWPIVVESARLSGRVLLGHGARGLTGAKESLHLTLRYATPDLTFSEIAPGRLRFYLSGRMQDVFPLYEMLFNNTLRIALASSLDQSDPTILGADAIQPVGFDLDEGLLPYPPQSFLGYRLVTEYFAFPQKFLFFDLVGLDPAHLRGIDDRLEIVIYFDRRQQDLEHIVSKDTFALGCTPVVNLFKQRAEPIQLNNTESEYRVVPNARRPQTTEVYSIDRVTVTTASGGESRYQPIYGTTHGQIDDRTGRYWLATRRAVDHDPAAAASEVYLSLVNLGLRPSHAETEYVSVETSCTNRNLPSRLPFGGSQPKLQLRDGGVPVARIVCLTAPTPTLRLPLGHGARWRLISHLVLNHLSITESANGTDAMREILGLYDYSESDETRAMIEGIVDVTSRPVNGRTPCAGPNGFCRGTAVAIELDEKRFPGNSAFVFGCVIERFLSLYCSINTFTRLEVRAKGRGIVRTWPPRPGVVEPL